MSDPDAWWSGMRGDGFSVSEYEDTNHDIPLYSGVNPVTMANAIRAAVEAEREACAKVCESIAFQYRNGGHGHAAERAANAIRARGAA